jgi:hypothetical protein
VGGAVAGIEGANAVRTDAAGLELPGSVAIPKDCDPMEDLSPRDGWTWCIEDCVTLWLTGITFGEMGGEDEEERIIWSLNDMSSFLNASTVALQREGI